MIIASYSKRFMKKSVITVSYHIEYNMNKTGELQQKGNKRVKYKQWLHIDMHFISHSRCYHLNKNGMLSQKVNERLKKEE